MKEVVADCAGERARRVTGERERGRELVRTGAGVCAGERDLARESSRRGDSLLREGERDRE